MNFSEKESVFKLFNLNKENGVFLKYLETWMTLEKYYLKQ